MIRFAVIGKGKMGQRWIGVLYELGKLNGIATRNYKDLKDIDAVIIAVPHKYLYPITRYFLKTGKHVLCEKPGGLTAKEVKKNIDLAKRKKLVYMVGYNCRFHDGFIKARKLYEKGKIGKLIFIRSRFGFGGRKNYDKEWRLNKEMSGGGHLHDQGVHMIDMAKSFMAEIKKVKGMVSNVYWRVGTEDNGFVILKDKNNVIASIHSSLTQWKRLHSFEIYGTKGYLIVEGLGMRYGEPERLILGKRTKDPDKVKETIIECNPVADDSLRLELKDFLSAIKNKRQPLMDAYETLKIVEEVYR
jgi:predicted dehydrogenase